MSDPVVKQMRKLDQKLKDVSGCIQLISRQNSQSRDITQIACIRRKQAAGATLQPDQESKMAREEEVVCCMNQIRCISLWVYLVI